MRIVIPIGPQDEGKDGEDKLQDGKLDGAELEQEKCASGVETEETNLWPLIIKLNLGDKTLNHLVSCWILCCPWNIWTGP